jgi:hypothetical protein
MTRNVSIACDDIGSLSEGKTYNRIKSGRVWKASQKELLLAEELENVDISNALQKYKKLFEERKSKAYKPTYKPNRDAELYHLIR